MVRELLTKHHIMYFEKGGNFTIKCLNPEHIDRNPSLAIHKETGVFHCFSCGFRGSFRKLQSLLGEDVSQSEETALLIKIKQLESRLKCMYSNEDRLDIVYPAHFSRYPAAYRGISQELLDQVGAFITNTEGMAHRLWFPLMSKGVLLGFQGRALIDEMRPKYVFAPSHINLRPVVYGIESVVKKTVVLTEGIFDMLTLRELGIKSACCIFGSSFSIEKLYSLLQHDIQVVVTCYDGDAAGKKATNETKHLLSKKAPHISVLTAYMPEGKDPGELTFKTIDEVFPSKDFGWLRTETENQCNQE